MSWHSVHIHYYDDQNELLLDGVRPLLRRLRGSVESAYFLRHWRQGPHVRLLLNAEPQMYADVVRPLVDVVIGDFLARRPSAASIKPADRLPEHRLLAAREKDTGPLMPWHPDNSIHDAEPDDQTVVLGGVEAARLLADFYCDTTELAFDMLAFARAGGQLQRIAFDLLVATAGAFWRHGLSSGFLGLRSLAELFLETWPEGHGVRSAWERHSRQHSTALAHEASDVAATLSGGFSGIPFVGEWVAAVAPFKERAGSLVADGALSLPIAYYLRGGPTGPMSEFHRTLSESRVYRERVAPSQAFAEYRVALNLCYLHLTRLGISPAQRFLLCHLAADAVETAYGITTRDLIDPRREPGAEPGYRGPVA